MTTLKEYMDEQMQDTEFREEWERLQPERERILLKKAEDLRAGRAKTYTPDEVRELCGLDD